MATNYTTKYNSAFLYPMNKQTTGNTQTVTQPTATTVQQTTSPTTTPTGTISSPTVESTVNAEDLKNVPEVVVPENLTSPEEVQKQATETVLSNAKQTTTNYDDLIKAAQGTTTAETERTSLSEQLKSALGELKGKGEALTAEQERLGVTESTKQLQNINQQIAQLQAGLELGLAQQEAKPIARQFIVGRQAEMRRQATAEIGALSTMAQALQGNITLAKQTAKETIDAKYSDAEQEIENIQTMLDLNKDNLTLEQQKKATVLELQLKARQDEIDKQKLVDIGIQNIMIQAAENGANQDTLQKISQSTNVQKAIQNAGTFMMTPTTKETNAPVKIGQNSKGEDIFFYGGSVVTGNQLLGDLGGGINDIIAQTFDDEAYNNAIAIRDGQLKLTDFKDPEMQQRIMKAQKTLPPSDTAIAEAEKMLANLKLLYDPETKTSHPGLNSAVGTAWTGRLPLSDLLTGQKDDFMTIASQVISKKALDSLIEEKSQGATFGALSDAEMQILKSASTAFAGREKGTGYDVTQKFFKDEITKFITEYQDLIDRAKDPLQLFPENNPVVQTAVKISDGEKGGQCGRFVNKLTGLGLGDSYQSKLAKMDDNITTPEPGMVFVMPYKDTGHTGIILGVNDDGTVTVKDSNWGLDEKVQTRKMPISKITGLARV